MLNPLSVAEDEDAVAVAATDAVDEAEDETEVVDPLRQQEPLLTLSLERPQVLPRDRRKGECRNRPSHIGHIPELRDTISRFTDTLLAATPAIPGLDSTIVTPPRRLHFTLGVMSLDLEQPSENSEERESGHVGASAWKISKTLEAARGLLREVKPKIIEILGEEKLRVSLDSMYIMPPERGDQERAHVMWIGPADGDGVKKFKQVAHLVVKSFKQAGLLVAEDRPLKLHCTVLNTIYRKPRTKARVPFSYPSVLASEAVKTICVQKGVVDAAQTGKPKEGPVHVNFGEWDLNEIQICEMGSWGPEGEYVAVARQSLIS
ncbi:hypothetical protein BD311DRAFT_677767 [Dichomitus squalens]|uniref:A-kinase anchor protein 7-like phosphoesterase domain-containing protein n=1 Tax=Dichomitus squalens TaxID=114155 RepID=A0A4V2JYM3_9APHY|nr:hypothetical protein BD311DRAFT_677767 [Dichomitus squalens]